LPRQLPQGTTGAALIVEGDGFEAGLAANLGEGITIKRLLLDQGEQQLMLEVDVAPDAPLGWHGLQLTHQHGLSATLAEGLEVVPGGDPVLTSLWPNEIVAGSHLFLQLFGRGLEREGLQLVFDGEGVTIVRVDPVDSQELILEVDVLPTAAAGPRRLSLRTRDGHEVELPDALTIRLLTDGEPPAGDPGDDDGCTVARGDGPGAGPTGVGLLLLALLLGRRRVEGGRG
ncbi:MAG: hypothetical protein RBU45_26280, partial [Myxococcota bacterium]|nr:hypothetical protein [Myxococcota bacterium]